MALTALLAGCSPVAEPSDPPQPGPESAELQQAASPAAPPRLVILVSLDTVRADHLSLYGYDRFTSPILDMLALEGVVFEDASAAAPWTLPSHASMLTGLYPQKHGVVTMADSLADEIPTLASTLAAEGYLTAAVVNSTWLTQQKYRLTRDFAKYLFVEESPERRSPNTWVSDQAIEWLREPRVEPMFLFMHYYDVHSDYASEPAFEKIFVRPYAGPADGTSWQLTASTLEEKYVEMCQKNFDPAKCRFGREDSPNVVDDSLARIEFGKADVEHIIDLYDAGIRQMDTEFGRFIGLLRKNGLLDDAVLIVTSDHGEEFMEHGRLEHFLPTYQELLHVPLVVLGPGVPKGVRVTAPVSLVDLAPTILGLLHVDSPVVLDGRSLEPLWWEAASRSPEDLIEKPSTAFQNRYLYGEASGGLTYDMMLDKGLFPIYRSVRKGRYKLIHESKQDRYALYDLERDRLEQVDISTEQPEVAAALRATLLQRYEEPLPASGARPPRVELSDEEIKRLRALGYVP